jgi:hypothetical protein
MKQLTIELDDDLYSFLELRAAIDDMRLKEGIEALLDEAVHRMKGGETRTRGNR